MYVVTTNYCIMGSQQSLHTINSNIFTSLKVSRFTIHDIFVSVKFSKLANHTHIHFEGQCVHAELGDQKDT